MRLTASCPAFTDSPSLRASHYIPSNTMRPSSWHIQSDNFGAWPYMSSEYSREKDEASRQRRIAQALQVSDKDFVIPSAALPIKGLCCFSHYDYDLSPYPVSSCSSFICARATIDVAQCPLQDESPNTYAHHMHCRGLYWQMVAPTSMTSACMPDASTSCSLVASSTMPASTKRSTSIPLLDGTF